MQIAFLSKSSQGIKHDYLFEVLEAYLEFPSCTGKIELLDNLFYLLDSNVLSHASKTGS